MTTSTTGSSGTDAHQPRPRRRQIAGPPPVSVRARESPRAMALWASVVVSLLAGSAAPTPLYALYQQAWGFTSITTTVIFGIYGIAVLAGLLVLGRLSDHLGRRPVTLAALVAQVVAMAVFASAGGVNALLIARVVQGVATGAAVAATGAALLDHDRVRGAVATAAAPGLGTAVGALVSGLLVTYLPAPSRLIYLLLVAVFLAQLVGIGRTTETTTRTPGGWASLRPRLDAPAPVRHLLLFTGPVAFAVWALAGFYNSLGPLLATELTGRASPVWGGLAPCLLTGTAALCILLTRTRPAVLVLAGGVLAVVVGLALIVAATVTRGVGLFVLGTVVAGAGFGGGFQGGVRLVMPRVAEHERAGTLGTLYVMSYLGMALPAVLAGVFVVYGGGVLVVARGVALAVIALCVFALAFLAIAHRRGNPIH